MTDINKTKSFKEQLNVLDIVKLQNGTLGIILPTPKDLETEMGVFTDIGCLEYLSDYDDTLKNKNSNYNIIAICKNCKHVSTFIYEVITRKNLSEKEFENSFIQWTILVKHEPQLEENDIVLLRDKRIGKVKNTNIVSIYDNDYCFSKVSEYYINLKNRRLREYDIIAIKKHNNLSDLLTTELNNIPWDYTRDEGPWSKVDK